MHVLVANDEDLQLRVQANFFEMSGFHVDKVSNGEDAINLVKRRLQGMILGNAPVSMPMYDLILLDINMPILNGYDACSAI